MTPSLPTRLAQLSLALCAPLLFLVCSAHAAAPGVPPHNGGPGGDFSEKNLKTISGTLHMKKAGEKTDAPASADATSKDTPSGDDNCDGYLISPQETYKLQTSNEKILKDLQERDGKKVSLQGNIDEKAQVIIVQKILDGVMPPAEQRNPRAYD
ncbi:MAG TPA: hypothetical protein VKX17_27355 [Planctomycetota bacterium]|nr:hypothetical protein [Planctomycetota bacterium]